MKKILYFIIPILLVMGCKKEEKIDPEQIKKQAVEEANKQTAEAIEEANKQNAEAIEKAKAHTYDFSLTFYAYDSEDGYTGFPSLPGDETTLVFLRDQTLDFKYHAMPYTDLSKGHLYSYTDNGGSVWCSISDLNATYRSGSIYPAITRNFRAVVIQSSQMRLSKPLASYSYAELKELYNLPD